MAKAQKLLFCTLSLLFCGCGTDNTPPALHGANPSSTGPAKVAATGQKTCSNQSGDTIDCAGTGQDGDLRKGVPLPSPRFTDNGDGTVTDNLSGLMWMQDVDCIGDIHPTFDTDASAGDGRVTWQHALDFAAAVNIGTFNCNVSTPHTDWRLPNRNEMMSLFNINYQSPALSNTAGNGRQTVGDPFTGTGWNYYWISTSYATPPSQAWIVYATYGDPQKTVKTLDYGVWLVRTGSSSAPALPAATGQTACYDTTGSTRSCANTGEDGELQKGVPIPSPRFTDNHDGTVTDNLTGLMWLKEANCIGNRLSSLDQDDIIADGLITWQHGLDFIAGLNYGAHDCGQSKKYTDWRMPNYNEMESLISPAYTSPAISSAAGNGHWTSGDPFTGLTGSDFYCWTSDSVADNSMDAWKVNIANGMIFNLITALKSQHAYLWPVRGGN